MLFIIQGANGNLTSTPIQLPDIRNNSIWSLSVFAANWGTASMTLQGSPDGVNWQDLQDQGGTVAFNSNQTRILTYRPKMYLRGIISGSSSGESNINATLV